MADVDLRRSPSIAHARSANLRYVAGRVAIYGFLGVLRAHLSDAAVRRRRQLVPRVCRRSRATASSRLPHSFSLKAWPQPGRITASRGTCEGIQRYFYNSLIMTIPATIVSTLLGAINGYVLSKWRFPGSETLFACMIARRVHARPDGAAALGVHARRDLRLSNSVYGLILVHCIQGSRFTTLFCRNYYVNIPDDLIKAARIDGAGFLRIFWSIVLPLSPPILIVTVIWQFTGIWNEFLFGVTFTGGTPAADHRGADRALDQSDERRAPTTCRARRC